MIRSMNVRAFHVALALSLAASNARAAAPGALSLKSRAIAPGGSIPSRYTCDGPDLSPPLEWADPPAPTKSFALEAEDPDAPGGTWVHWVAWNIPAEARALPEGIAKQTSLPDGTRQGRNDFERVGYGGPCPPAGTHRYVFNLYALDATLSLPATAGRGDLDKALRGHLLAKAELMGTYGRR